MAGRRSNLRKWPEVKNINDFAAFMGCLTMAIRGLGFLGVTWTTVVLLGGFVSLLQKKDFWCLTVITFIQIAGVADSLGIDKWNSVGTAASGLDVVGKVFARNRLAGTLPPGRIARVLGIVKQLLGFLAWWVQAATYMVGYFCGLCGFFYFGPLITTGVSLWRLKQHDYGSADGDSSKANMTPALDILYTIVVVQGAIFAYRTINAFVYTKVVSQVAETYGFQGSSVMLVRRYSGETSMGCYKNPSFAKGRNLVTYAVDLTASPQDRASGVKILSTILGPLRGAKSEEFKEQRMLIRQLILYAPSSHIFRHLLVLSNPRSRPYGSEMHLLEETEKSEQREIRKHAASVVMHMADGASLEQLPQVIQCMSSLIGTFEEHQRFFSSSSTDHGSNYAKEEDYLEEEKDYLERLWEGLHVLYVLAADENNCRLIIHTPGLLTKITTPLTPDRFHKTDHKAWGDVQLESLKVIHRLTVVHEHGETGAKLLREIPINLEAVKTMMRTLRCDERSQEMEILAMGIATNLHMQTQTTSRKDFIEKLADIYTYSTTNSTKISALEALAALCFQDGGNAAIILQVNGSAVHSFTGDLEALSDGYQTYHVSVAEILQHACLHYTRDDECLRMLKESMTYVMPKVLNKILTAEEAQTGQQSVPLQDNGQNRSSSSLQEIQDEDDIWKIQNMRNQKKKIETALLSFCVIVHETFISADPYLALQFDSSTDASGLPMKLKEMVERNIYPTASCLKILKLTSKMVISIMKCRGNRYPKQELGSLVEALSKACSRQMKFIDRSMDFASGEDAAKPGKPDRILASFVAEATELVRDYGEPEAMLPITIVGGELSSN